MQSPPATMAKATRAGATPRCCCLPEEIAIWEILVHLPPKSLLRFRAVCRTWRRVTSTRDFLLVHHGCQPSLQIIWGEPVSRSKESGASYDDFLAFDHRATDAKLQPVARLDESYYPEAACDGLLILSKRGTSGTCYSICNPATREHAPIGTPWNFSIFSLLGLYLHRPTGEYRLLLHRRIHSEWLPGSLAPGFYIFVLGSDQPSRYIRGPYATSGLHAYKPCLVQDLLHWFPVQHQSEDRLILVFNTTTELFWRICVPVVCAQSNIFEMDDTLGIYSYDDAMKAVDIWVLQNYEDDVWEYKYQVKLPVGAIRGQLGIREDNWYVDVVSADGDILLLLSHGGWMFYINTDGELVDSFHCDGQNIYAWDLRLKQTLVSPNFLTTLEGYVVNASPFL